MELLIVILLWIMSVIYLANAGTALFFAKMNKEKGYFNSILLIIAGTCTVLLLVLVLIFSLERRDNKNLKSEKIKYELIQEPVYKKITCQQHSE